MLTTPNLTKMANQKGYGVTSEKLEEQKYRVVLSVTEVNPSDAGEKEPAEEVCATDARGDKVVVVISSSKMGEGDDELGSILTQQEKLPSTILFYNGGAFLTCEGAPTLEDLKALEAQGVEILTCGTCLNHYGMTEKLQVGEVTNMYVIAEKMTQAKVVVKP